MELIGFKICKECKNPKPNSEFYKNGGDRLSTNCIECFKKKRCKYNKPKQIKQCITRFIFDDNKICSICNEIKNRKLFMQHSSKCKVCSEIPTHAPYKRKTKDDYIVDGKKECTICYRWKEVGLFYKSTIHVSGCASGCKSCATVTRYELKAFYVKPTKQDKKDEFLKRWDQMKWKED